MRPECPVQYSPAKSRIRAPKPYISAGTRAVIKGTSAMSASRQTRGRLNMQPSGLNIYTARSCTENARFCRWSRSMACRFSWIRAERRRSGAQSERESGGGYPQQGRLPGSSMHVTTDIRPDGPGARPVLHRSSGYAAAVLRRRAGQGWHEQIISESRPVAHGADGKVTEILIGPVRPLLAAAVWR
jgi:hypothetical protein